MSIALRPDDRPALAAESVVALPPTALSVVLPGHFRCTAIDDSALSPARMKSLGICVGRPLELVSAGDPMIVRVCGSTVGISRRLAAAVTVVPLLVAAESLNADI